MIDQGGTMEDSPRLAVIGGSGLYEMPGFTDTQDYFPDTPFGKPSAPIIVGSLDGRPMAFLARHGIGHHITPGEVNYRANIYSLKSLGVERIVSISACGSLREDFAPGDIVIPDQIFDFTKDRERSFFGEGLVAHINVANPFCPDFSKMVYEAASQTGGNVRLGGSMITIEGPRFSTKSESHVYRSWGMSLIGMTTSPEAFLAREAEICYAVMAHVTDYDVWHSSEESVSVEQVIAVLNQNTQKAQQAVKILAENWKPERDCNCGNALQNALITAPNFISPEARQKLELLVGKYLN
jgi:5'-methylthioadenosine phosphorylase